MNLPSTIEDVIDHLDRIIHHSLKHNSRLGYFPALYRKVTIEVREKIAEGYFDDNARMEKLDVVFANRYLEAYYQYQNGEPSTLSWTLSFEKSRSWNPMVVQHLLLGMNAHISLDLGIAAAEVSKGKDIQLLHSDFMKINEILASLVDHVQWQLAKMWPLLKPIDWIAGKLDEKLAIFAMDIARDAAWQVASDYSRLATEPDKMIYLKNRDEKVKNFGSKIATPGFVLSIIIKIFRLMETGSVNRKIKYLQ
jgi:hypothetical protein